ncbi:hypothetical protein K1T71_011011 [Dendrolimus kikuchii]|uniref:Uncharacterized protein n=1 Tax=Dendrolimus kikuchii TaxID=765133 RepID=A0ACC1CRH1_9NEOP|nr:hypothetical protein K1T71_011011 [Dendrolimus kikuchii]
MHKFRIIGLVVYSWLIQHLIADSRITTTRKEKVTTVQWYFGPKRERPEFDPSWAYDQYWTNGSWAFKQQASSSSCMEECPIAYVIEDCDGSQGWRIAHKGKCMTYASYYPTAFSKHYVRADKYIKDYYSRHPTTTKSRTFKTRRQARTSKSTKQSG